MNLCSDIDKSVKPCKSFVKDGFCTLPGHYRCPEYLVKHDFVWSHSSLDSWLRCRRKFYWSSIRGLQLVEPRLDLVLGNLAHALLQSAHEGRQFETMDATKELNSYDELQIGQTFALCKAYAESKHCLSGYAEQHVLYEDETPGFGFRDNLTTLKVHGYVDLVSQDCKHITEIKYTGSPNRYNFWTMQRQMAIYMICLPEAETISILPLTRPRLRIVKGTLYGEVEKKLKNDFKKRPGFYLNSDLPLNFHRIEFSNVFDKVINRLRVVCKEASEIINLKGIDYYWQNEQACYNPFECEYLPICQVGEVPEHLYKKRSQ